MKTPVIYNKGEERDNKNMYCTAEAIDNRQVLELSVVLDGWLKGNIKPRDVLIEVADITGAYVGFKHRYEFYQDYAPGTDKFEEQIKGAQQTVLEKQKNFAAKTRDKLAKKHQKTIDDLEVHIKPEVLHGNAKLQKSIKDIYAKLENDEFSSWQAAIAIVETILIPPPSNGDKLDNHPLNEFKDGINTSQKLCERDYPASDSQETLYAFKPKTEKETKEKLTYFISVIREWRALNEEREAEGERAVSLEYFNLYYNLYEEDIKDTPIIDFPDHYLCNEMDITPSGTGLIQFYGKRPVKPAYYLFFADCQLCGKS